MTLGKSVVAGLMLAMALIRPGVADEHERRGNRQAEHRQAWHGEIRRFHEHDLALWRGGHWVHGRHGARGGWWWVVGGLWYFYPTPVYPYPDPYQPPVVTIQPMPAAPQSWYYCADPAGYYPYVAQCRVGWQAVPASPAPAPAPSPAP